MSRRKSEACRNILQRYRDPETRKFVNLTAIDFQNVWNHFDEDHNGYIENKELDNFLRKFIASVNVEDSEYHTEVISDAALKCLKQEIMLAFDENEDGRLEVGELAQILPLDEEFLVLFQREFPLDSSATFMKIWRKYDTQKNGYITAPQLEQFLQELCDKSPNTTNTYHENLKEYSKIILQLFDSNEDGKLQLSEMARLLPVKENFLVKPIFRKGSFISEYQIERIFKVYDTDGNAKIGADELEIFLKDLFDLTREEYDGTSLSKFKKIIMDQWDSNHDGFIDREELKEIFRQQKLLCECRKLSNYSGDEENSEMTRRSHFVRLNSSVDQTN